MNVRAIAGHIEFSADRDLAAQDDAQHQREVRAALINARANEINQRRSESFSDEDMALALETLSTYTTCIGDIKRGMVAHGASFAYLLEIYVLAALLPDSLRQARQEFEKMDAEPDGARH
jgi:hypothetical protein